MLTKYGSYVYSSQAEEKEMNLGDREKRDMARLPNGSIYLGEWLINTNVKEGKGVQVWPVGSLYEGYWLDNKANFRGRLLHKDGDIY